MGTDLTVVASSPCGLSSVMEDNCQSKINSCGSKRTASEAFANRLLTDVPECYNYGVFFDDGYDYMKHMKTMEEFLQDRNYIVEGEEDGGVPDDYVPPVIEPVVEDDPVDDDFEILTDDELIAEHGELEDNFVELAGGKQVLVDDNDDAVISGHENHNAKSPLSAPNLPQQKVLLMERYLWGAHSADVPPDDLFEVPDHCASSAALRKGRPLTDGEDLLEKQFNKLMQVTKASNGFDSRSLMSCASVMSENLESVVRADEIMIAKRQPQNNDWKCPDTSFKETTLHCLEGMTECDDEDPLKNWVGEEKIPLNTILSAPQVFATKDKFLKQPEVLAMPKRHTSAKLVKIAEDTEDISSSLHSEKGSDNDDRSDAEVDLNRRVKGETAEEKRTRKAALKEQKRDRQQAKKINKVNFRRVPSKPCKFGSVNGGSAFVD